MPKPLLSAQNLTDAEVLDEFVRRFQCDGAVLVYLDSDAEYGFGRWRNSRGRHWVKNLFKRVKQTVLLPAANREIVGGTTVCLST